MYQFDLQSLTCLYNTLGCLVYADDPNSHYLYTIIDFYWCSRPSVSAK